MTDQTRTFPTRDKIVYIREVATADLPAEAQAQVDQPCVYAIHGADGERLALTVDRDSAFALARHNDMAPVSAH